MTEKKFMGLQMNYFRTSKLLQDSFFILPEAKVSNTKCTAFVAMRRTYNTLLCDKLPSERVPNERSVLQFRQINAQ